MLSSTGFSPQVCTDLSVVPLRQKTRSFDPNFPVTECIHVEPSMRYFYMIFMFLLTGLRPFTRRRTDLQTLAKRPKTLANGWRNELLSSRSTAITELIFFFSDRWIDIRSGRSFEQHQEAHPSKVVGISRPTKDTADFHRKTGSEPR